MRTEEVGVTGRAGIGVGVTFGMGGATGIGPVLDELELRNEVNRPAEGAIEGLVTPADIQAGNACEFVKEEWRVDMCFKLGLDSVAESRRFFLRRRQNVAKKIFN